MRETNDLGDLPHEVQPRIDIESPFFLSQEMVEPNRPRVVLEDERGAQGMLRQAINAQYARMLQALKELKLAQGRALVLLRDRRLMTSRSHVVNAARGVVTSRKRTWVASQSW